MYQSAWFLTLLKPSLQCLKLSGKSNFRLIKYVPVINGSTVSGYPNGTVFKSFLMKGAVVFILDN